MAQSHEENKALVKQLIKEKELEDMAKEVQQGSEARNIIEINYESPEGIHYKGKIMLKRPNVMDLMKAGGRKSEILREAGVVNLDLVDPAVKFMAQAISTLEVVVVKSPEWFLDIASITDLDIIFHVYGRYEGWENSFRIANILAKEEDSESSE